MPRIRIRNKDKDRDKDEERLTATADSEAHGAVAGGHALLLGALRGRVAHPLLSIVTRARVVVESHNLKHAEH